MRSLPRGPCRGLILRGKVLNTYLPDDPLHPGAEIQAGRIGPVVLGQVPDVPVQRLAPEDRRGICCDVLIFSDGFRSLLRMVPVRQPRGGRSDSDRWIPRGVRASVSGSPAVVTKELGPGEGGGAITRPSDLDGDTVTVEFLNGDYCQPLITGAIEHWHAEQEAPAYRLVTPTQGPANERVIRHRGSVVRVDSDGNIEIDATRASSGAIDATGAELPGVQGALTIRAKAGQVIRIEGGDGAAGRIELVPAGGVAAKDVARVGDPARANFVIGSLVATDNPIWDTFLTALVAEVDTLATAAGRPAVHAVNYANAKAAGLISAITHGNPNVRTD